MAGHGILAVQAHLLRKVTPQRLALSLGEGKVETLADLQWEFSTRGVHLRSFAEKVPDPCGEVAISTRTAAMYLRSSLTQLGAQSARPAKQYTQCPGFPSQEC